MNGTYKLHDFVVESIHDGVLEDGILYKLDGEVKTQLREIDYWYHGQYGYDLCVISIGGLFGYADIQSGQIVHQPQWEDALPFYGERARVKENGKFGFINRTGEYVIEPEWDDVEHTASSGLLAVCKDKKWGFINNADKLVTPLEWDAFAHSLLSGRILTGWAPDGDYCYKNLPRAVRKDNKWGFINDDGHIVIEPQFDTLDFIWFNFQVEDWLEDKAAAVLVKSDKELTMTLFGRTVTPSDMTVYPMYLPAKRGNRWYRVQMGVDGKISILRNKYPKKNKDI